MGWQKVQYLHPSIPHQKVTVEEISVDYNFVETLELKLLQGRSFSKDYAMDATNAAILSESAVEHFGLTNPVGSTIQQSEKESLQVIGVIADINMRSMKQGFMPLVLRMTEDNLYEVVVRFAPGTFDKTITFLEEKMKMFNTKNPMDFITAKDYTNYLYRKEAKLKKILGTFMLLAAFISIMGLFALSLFMVRQKTKIIGIHKVFGASLKDIIRLLLSNFLVLVLIANIIAWPLGWYLSNRWLEEYSFRVGFSIQGYLIALLASVLLVAITVLINAVRAARTRPVDSLKYE
jgi:putative ABC transport system permease protein